MAKIPTVMGIVIALALYQYWSCVCHGELPLPSSRKSPEEGGRRLCLLHVGSMIWSHMISSHGATMIVCPGEPYYGILGFTLSDVVLSTHLMQLETPGFLVASHLGGYCTWMVKM